MWTTNINEQMTISYNKSNDFEPITVPKMFHNTVLNNKDKICMAWKENTSFNTYHNLAKSAINSKWNSMTFKDVEQEIYNLGGALNKFGLENKDTVIIMGYNSPQWLLSFHATIQAGGVVVGCYSTNEEDTCLYLANNSNAKFVIVESWHHGKKFLKALNDPNYKLSKIIIWGELVLIENENIISFKDFIDYAPSNSKEIITQIENNLNPGECCNIIYTSGTTGFPKGVMLSHDNLTWDIQKFISTIFNKTGKQMGNEQVLLSYLPLSHIAAQMLDFMIGCCTGGSIYFATSDALKGGLLPLLQQVRPTFLFGVPRVWEKIMDAMKEKSVNNNCIKNKIVNCAKYVGLNANNSLANSGGEDKGCYHKLGIYWLFNKLVYNKIKKLLGLDRCELFGSGAAPISKNVLSFFWSLDIPIVEGYGMSETTGITTLCLFPEQVKLGSVGFGLTHDMIKISNDNEILIKGRSVMMGYLNNFEKTQETFTSDGYLKTGDLGSLFISNDGTSKFLKITGRKKELIITAGGENIAPVPIEDKIKYSCPIISNIILIGDNKKFLSVLITLRVVIDQETLLPTEELDNNCKIALKKIGIESNNVNEVINNINVLNLIQKSIDEYNNTAVSRAQRVQKFKILNTDFSVPGGELTESQKLKRSVVINKYETEINNLYK